MKILLATHNVGKLKEFQKLFSPLNVTLFSLNDFQLPSIEETGKTFLENALLKARAASKATGLPVIADDSGLEVDALDGAPGIYSARYAGEGADDKANIKKLLQALSTVPAENRGAQFKCVLVFLPNVEDNEPIISEGLWRGQISHEERGSQGFGYDPIFFIEEENCTAAQLTPDEKNKLSHRAKALNNLLEKMKYGNILGPHI